MSAGHTRGPWEARGCELVGEGTLIATLHWHSGRETENAADAALIAAAPCLYNAAARLITVFDQQRMTAAERIIVGVSDAGLRTEGNAAIEALRAALARVGAGR